MARYIHTEQTCPFTLFSSPAGSSCPGLFCRSLLTSPETLAPADFGMISSGFLYSGSTACLGIADSAG